MKRKKTSTDVPTAPSDVPLSEAKLSPLTSLLMMAKADYEANGHYANAPYKLFTDDGEFIGKIEERSDRDPKDANKSVTKTRLVVIRPAMEIDYELVNNADYERQMMNRSRSYKRADWLYDSMS